MQTFHILGSGIPASGKGGQQLGNGEQGTGDGAPPMGFEGPQQGSHGPHGGGHDADIGCWEHALPPPPTRRFLTPIVILAKRKGNAEGQQFGVGRHMQAERP